MRTVLALLIVSIPLARAGADDLAELRKGEILLRLTDMPGSRFSKGAVRGVVEAPLQQVFEVIVDYDHYKDFMPKAKESEILERDGNRIRYYSKINLPWPISDIWFTTDVRYAEDRRRIRFEMVPETGHGVRAFHGEWELAEFDGEAQRTLAAYEVYFEPTTRWPKWVMNLGTRSTLTGIVTGVRKRVREVERAARRPREAAPESTP